jgi:DinB superfamily
MNLDTNTISTFKTNADLLSKMMKAIPAEKWLERPSDHSNHPLWIVGHVVATRGIILRLLGGTWDTPWQKMFDRGAALASPDSYPSVDELKRGWELVSAQLMTTLEGVSAETLGQPGPKGIPSFDQKMSGTIAFFGFHETYHVGQLAYLTKWLGGEPVVG